MSLNFTRLGVYRLGEYNKYIIRNSLKYNLIYYEKYGGKINMLKIQKISKVFIYSINIYQNLNNKLHIYKFEVCDLNIWGTVNIYNVVNQNTKVGGKSV